MKSIKSLLFYLVPGAFALFFLQGCYTQFGTTRDDDVYSDDADQAYVAPDSTMDSTSAPVNYDFDDNGYSNSYVGFEYYYPRWNSYWGADYCTYPPYWDPYWNPWWWGSSFAFYYSPFYYPHHFYGYYGHGFYGHGYYGRNGYGGGRSYATRTGGVYPTTFSGTRSSGYGYGYTGTRGTAVGRPSATLRSTGSVAPAARVIQSRPSANRVSSGYSSAPAARNMYMPRVQQPRYRSAGVPGYGYRGRAVQNGRVYRGPSGTSRAPAGSRGNGGSAAPRYAPSGGGSRPSGGAPARSYGGGGRSSGGGRSGGGRSR